MRITRTKNTIRNIAFGFVNRIINIILPFFSRTAILYIMGTKYLGLNSLFTSILSFLSLAELGVGAAMVYSMYKPIAENDEDAICALLNLYKRVYNIIGSIILGVGLMLTPFLNIIIKDDVPQDVNLYVLYFLYLINAVLSYWLFAYKNALLQAYQRTDVNSKISSIITPISYAVMLGCLFVTKDYYAYIIWQPIFTILTNVLRVIYVNKMFPTLKPRGEIDREVKESITKKVTALIGTKLNTVVLNAADNLVMSAFLGLTAIAIYGNYYYVMSSIIGFLGICYSAMTAGLGNSLAVETVEKNYNDFKKFSFINSWLVGWCTVCLACLYQPFMKIWAGEKLMFSLPVVLQICIYFYIYQIRKIPVVYKDAAGIWWEDRFRPYVCMVVNVVLNILLVQVIGVSGIVVSTVISLLVSIPWENFTIFKYVFQRSSKEYYVNMFSYALYMLIAGVITYFLCDMLEDGIPQLFIRAIICVVVPNLIFVGAVCRKTEFKETICFIKSILKKEI